MNHTVESQSLVITEIYRSVQGESSYAGLPCTFVRLTGCPLRCRWCDTVYGFEGGQERSIGELVDDIKALGVPLVEITGGEPLAQKNTVGLMKALIEAGFQVICETGGSEPVEGVPPEVTLIMDLKCPGSGMADRNLWENLNHLKPSDEIKFVIANRDDFDWACHVISRHDLTSRFHCLMSVAFGLLAPAELVDWILDADINVRLNLQQHKYIWSPKKKGV
ncbi:radical SAM protein [Pseudobacteriovorax antillogorgiicola]|uniref:7-carboxy-7-deazaguanine synthase n=1 Tax=Pseudobacteriovorax antillogorgiicola TaxID=1513793 RepID=A0A1Y6B6E8_9BACT|nr:radical SAM protein [Pseudobacteriovorax antillogorgiicola]TCS59216.1 7-carboxy-7-deazaguanine synthase [Pseudobacteriovorax antillogorgiicola]SME90444.1 7-carboxy-7-deazaguanine synthase [Pseudobacteriovorax antillogorgiicola]